MLCSLMQLCSLNVLTAADVLASGSVDAVLEGRHYNQGLRVHKLVSEVLE